MPDDCLYMCVCIYIYIQDIPDDWDAVVYRSTRYDRCRLRMAVNKSSMLRREPPTLSSFCMHRNSPPGHAIWAICMRACMCLCVRVHVCVCV